MIQVKEIIERREKLYDCLKDNSVLILYAGVAKKKSADETYDFCVNKNFYYLTGVKQEGSILFVAKQDGIIKEYLFVSEYDELKEKWTGKRLTSDEARALSGIDNVMYLNAFESELDLILKKKDSSFERISMIYFDLEPENIIEGFKTVEETKDILKLNYPWLEVEDVYSKIVSLRMVKSKDEISELKEAINKTNIGLKNILKKIRPGLYEYQLSSLFYYTIQDYDFSELSFPTICASGVNATCLHYPTPLAKIKDGDLVLFDLGSQNNFYCGDISRTYPANGRFSDLQRTIYTIVLECNKLIIDTIKPGITIKELNDIATNFMAKECVKAGLIQNESEIRKYYFHSIGHHLGLDTHDPADRNLPLVPGNVITDEPGLYFKELGIGVRIEDDILVTEDGSYNLSGSIIKEIDDIERALGSR